MSEVLKDKVAIVTGGCSGIGKGIVEAYIEQGCKVVIADIDDAAGNQLAEQLGADKAAFVFTDVSVEADMKNCVEKAVETFGGLDIMVNSAGIPGVTRNIEEATVEEFDRLMKIDLLSVILGMKYAVPQMKKRGEGSIINISSVLGKLADGNLFYNIAKTGVNMATRLVAYQAGEHKIRANAIAPGAMATPIQPKSLGLEVDEEILEKLKKHFTTVQPLKNDLGVEELADVAVFLGSDNARLVTGQIIDVDGGATLPTLPLDNEGYFRTLDPSGALLEKMRKDGLL